ncbi:hypothetical protein NE237_026166 [Protea cynaroides]|uniref:Uncharacterized protein n=1 Tax=Protea cynaroides TaxID=273540 RepID=A0A9Q0H4E2_9MAGN|nr:hypothetical protein NE237_026166 [Protea cynaroides]
MQGKTICQYSKYCRTTKKIVLKEQRKKRLRQEVDDKKEDVKKAKGNIVCGTAGLVSPKVEEMLFVAAVKKEEPVATIAYKWFVSAGSMCFPFSGSGLGSYGTCL